MPRTITCLLSAAALAACSSDPGLATDAGSLAAESGKDAGGEQTAAAGRTSAGSAGRTTAGQTPAPPRDAALPDASSVAQPSAADDAGSGEDAGPSPRPNELSLERAMQTYTGWTKRTPEPQAISASIFSLCRLPSLAEQRFVESQHGKDMLLLLDWLNEPAARSFGAGDKPVFAPGSAIVKQKLRQGASGPPQVAALGLMIKRAPGFDPAHGDWEYGYWEEASGLSRGPEAQNACGNCHASSRTDHVFLDASWRLPPP